MTHESSASVAEYPPSVKKMGFASNLSQFVHRTLHKYAHMYNINSKVRESVRKL